MSKVRPPYTAELPQQMVELVRAGPFEAEGKASQLTYRHGGGWEVVVGGMFTATVPVGNKPAPFQDLQEAGTFPVGLARTA